MNDATEPTGRRFDSSSDGLARRFGARAVQMIRDGRDPFVAVRLAATYAARVLHEQQQALVNAHATETVH